MATQVSHEWMRGIGQLRYEPTPKRIRAKAGGHTVLDSRRAVIVWEPRRVVPSYAAPEEDVRASCLPGRWRLNSIRCGWGPMDRRC